MGDIALISDVHGNHEALLAVMADMDKRGNVDRVICLGDIVGYGPDPVKCLDTLQTMANFDCMILGNHDAAILDPDVAANFNQRARVSVDWTMRQVFSEENNPNAARDKNFLNSLGQRIEYNDNILLVHASPRSPVQEYVFPTDIFNQEKMEENFEIINRFCFHGHTHYPGVFSNKNGQFKFYPPDYDPPFNGKQPFPDPGDDEKLLVNVGSVGQPRDKDPRSSYLIFNEEFMEFRRVEYDYEITVDKITEVDELDNMLGERLRFGR
jgi:diadenosine tetraphosphatase ApaH/serine/threonine PP2A family protein phosphatase